MVIGMAGTSPAMTPCFCHCHPDSGRMIYRPAQLRYRTRKRRESSMVQKIALEEHFLSPGVRRAVAADGRRDAGGQARVPAGRPDRLRRAAARLHGQGRHHARGAGARRARRAGSSATPPRRSATLRSSNDFLAKEIQKRPDRYSGFAHLAMQDAKAAADELERCVTRAEVLRRHDQQPHQRAVPRPSVAGAVLGARRGARHADLPASGRSGRPSRPCCKAIRGCAAPPGNGASRPARTRCG